MLSAESVKKACKPDVYAAGELLVRRKKVLRFSEDFQPDGTQLISALVEGNYGYVHQVRLLLSGEDQGEQLLLSYACNCYERQNGWGLCRHCAAVGVYAAGQEVRQPVPPTLPKRPDRKTSKRLAGYMSHYSAAALNLNDGVRAGTVVLEPTVTLEAGETGLSGTVGLRIGINRMYVVRNLSLIHI